MRVQTIVQWMLITVLVLGLNDAAASESRLIAIRGGMLIDGYGGEPLQNAVVLIEGNRIKAVGTVDSLTIPPDARVIDAEGKTIMPGIMDMHVHLMILGHSDYAYWFTHYRDKFRDVIMPIAARQLLMAGVTTVRDVGAALEDIIPVKKRIQKGEIPGPRLFISGPFLQVDETITPDQRPFRWGVKSVEDARQKVRGLARAGVDLIKMIDQDKMHQSIVDAIVDEAHRHGLHVAAHSHKVGEILKGLRAGVDCFEHTGLATMPEYPKEVMRGIRLRNASLYWVPTIEGLYLYAETERFPERLDDPRLRETVPEPIYLDIRNSLKNISKLEYFYLTKRRIPTLARKFNQLRQAGVTLLIGTDSGIPMNYHFDSTWREMWTWERLGMDRMDIIRAATYWPARLLKQPDLGVIAPGKLADVIVINGNPLESMRDMRNIDTVIKDGKLYVEHGRWVASP